MAIKLKCFISYSHKDIKFKHCFDTYAKVLETRMKLIDTWYDGMIPAGENVSREVKHNLENADVIFLLLSPNYVASYSCYEKELMYAIDKHNQGKAKVIPILLKSIPMIEDLPFSGLKTLPHDRRPVSKFKSYDEGFSDVFKIVLRDLKEYYNAINTNSNETSDHINKQPNMIQFQLLRNGKMSTIIAEPLVMEYIQNHYIYLQSEFMLKMNIVLRTHISEFQRKHEKNSCSVARRKKTDWWNTCLYQFLFELSGVLQKYMIGNSNTCIHFRYLKKNAYETFVAIGYEEPFIPKSPIPSDDGTIYASMLFNYPLIKSKNTRLHRISHPDESINRDYITFTFKNLVDKYSLYLSMCISIVGRKQPRQQNMLLSMSVLRLDYIIGSYIDLYLDSCKRIDERLNFERIGG